MTCNCDLNLDLKMTSSRNVSFRVAAKVPVPDAWTPQWIIMQPWSERDAWIQDPTGEAKINIATRFENFQVAGCLKHAHHSQEQEVGGEPHSEDAVGGEDGEDASDRAEAEDEDELDGQSEAMQEQSEQLLREPPAVEEQVEEVRRQPPSPCPFTTPKRKAVPHT